MEGRQACSHPLPPFRWEEMNKKIILQPVLLEYLCLGNLEIQRKEPAACQKTANHLIVPPPKSGLPFGVNIDFPILIKLLRTNEICFCLLYVHIQPGKCMQCNNPSWEALSGTGFISPPSLQCHAVSTSLQNQHRPLACPSCLPGLTFSFSYWTWNDSPFGLSITRKPNYVVESTTLFPKVTKHWVCWHRLSSDLRLIVQCSN